MYLRRIARNVDPTSETTSERLPSGNIFALGYLVTGTTDTGETLDPDDLTAGGAVVTRRDISVHRAELGPLYRFADDLAGAQQTVTPTAGDTTLLVLQPFAAPFAPRNALSIANPNRTNLTVHWDNATLGTRFAGTPNAEVFAVMAPTYSESYVLRATENTLSFNGAGSDSLEYNQSNVFYVELRDPSNVVANITAYRTIQGTQEDVKVRANPDLIRADHDFVSDREAVSDEIPVNLMSGLSPADALSSTAELLVETSGAGDITATAYYVENAGEERFQSREQAINRLREAVEGSNLVAAAAGANGNGNGSSNNQNGG